VRPQGSVLRLLLILIYTINHIVNAYNFNTILYADDIKLHISGKTIKIYKIYELKNID